MLPHVLAFIVEEDVRPMMPNSNAARTSCTQAGCVPVTCKLASMESLEEAIRQQKPLLLYFGYGHPAYMSERTPGRHAQQKARRAEHGTQNKLPSTKRCLQLMLFIHNVYAIIL